MPQQGHKFWTGWNCFFFISFHILDLNSLCFRWNSSRFYSNFEKKWPQQFQKIIFFQMWNKIRFLNACCVIWALRIHPNHWQKKNWIHKTTKMKYRPHFWPNSTKTGKIWENWAGSRLLMGCDEFCDSKTRKRLLVPNIIDRGREEIWPFFHQFWPPLGYL